jgi:glycosyltransferase involved in cell wall biosynthesis
MKLKILHIAQFLGVGGLEKVLLLLINEQLRDGHDVELVIYDYEQSWVSHFREQGIKVDTSFKKSEGYDLKLLKYLATKCKNVDVIHTHDLNPLMYAAPLKFLHVLGGRQFPRLIHSAHGMDHIHRRPITKVYEKLCSFQTTATVGVSAAVCDYYRSLGVPTKKVHNINNGTQIPMISGDQRHNARLKLRKDLGLSSASVIWVSVARVVPLKDQMLICHCARSFPDMIFLVVGPSGDDNYWNLIETTKPKNVFMLGARSDITEILLGADYFVSASTHEGIPVSVLEAGAIGLPCLLSEIPGHKLIQSESNEAVAIFFKTGDVQDMKEKVVQLTNNQNQTIGLGLTLKHHVEDKFSSTTMYENYLRIYLGSQCFKS